MNERVDRIELTQTETEPLLATPASSTTRKRTAHSVNGGGSGDDESVNGAVSSLSSSSLASAARKGAPVAERPTTVRGKLHEILTGFVTSVDSRTQTRF